MKLQHQIEEAAANYGIIVEWEAKGVYLMAPEGYRFDIDLHGLVVSQYDNQPMPNVYRSALKDIVECGPRLEKCPPDCSCKQSD